MNKMLTEDEIKFEYEKKQILNAYKGLLKACKPHIEKGDRKVIRDAFNMALKAHDGTRRRSGEPYILHPIAVATITAQEIGLGTVSVISALLHDVVEDTDVALAEIQQKFGTTVAQIVDGLTKIDVVYDVNSTKQAENVRKILLTLAKDVRIILIKLADRLHNMRTIDSMEESKRVKIASETTYLYVPVAHRLGLYSIKSELEDICLKILEPETYRSLAEKIAESKRQRDRYIQEFIRPIKAALEEEGFKFEINGRSKSISSIYHKMKTKQVDFDDIYDLNAIRIIISSELNREKSDCWAAYSVITDIFQPITGRLRDWISHPKANGYESLHLTVQGPKDKHVEVQIRSTRMNEVAEHGYAAHWKYKENHDEVSEDETLFDTWLQRVRDVMSNPEEDTLQFIESVKEELLGDQTSAVTPKGRIIQLPKGATMLDFAYELHSQLGDKAIGAKVNYQIVPLNHKVSNGDIIEIITSERQHPQEDWMTFVYTAKARSKIRDYFNKQRQALIDKGKQPLEETLAALGAENTIQNLNYLMRHLGVKNTQDIQYSFGAGNLTIDDLRMFPVSNGNFISIKHPSQITDKHFETVIKNKLISNNNILLFGDKGESIDYEVAECCQPMPGDNVFGYINKDGEIEIHKASCPKAVTNVAKFGYRIINTKWNREHQPLFLTGISMMGIDDKGVVLKIAALLTEALQVNMQSIFLESKDGLFEGYIKLYVHDTTHLLQLIEQLKALDGILEAKRLDTDEEEKRFKNAGAARNQTNYNSQGAGPEAYDKTHPFVAGAGYNPVK